MISLLRLTVKNIAERKVRFLLTTVSVLLGVMFTVGVFIFSDSLRAVFSELSEDIAGRNDLSVRSQLDFGNQQFATPVDPVLADVIESLEGVQATSPVITEFGVAVSRQGELLRSRAAPSISFNWTENEDMSNLFLVDGRPPRDGTEFVMNTTSINTENLVIGEIYTIQLPDGPRDVTLVGSFNFGDPNRDRSIGAYLTALETETAEEVLNGGQGWDQIDIDVRADFDIATVRLEVEQAVEQACSSGVADCPSEIEIISIQELLQEQQDEFGPFISTFRTIMLVFAAVILAVSVFVIFNTFTILLGQRIKEFGLMRAVGTTGNQVVGIVLGEAALVGLLSSGLGFLAGVGLSYLLRWIINFLDLDIPLETFVILPRTVLFAFLVGTGVTLLSALVPALRARRISPIAALRDDAGFVLREGLSLRQVPKNPVLGSLLVAGGIAMSVIALFSSWRWMIVWSLIGVALITLGGWLVNSLAGRWAVLALGVVFFTTSGLADYQDSQQWMALGIGAVLLIAGIYLVSPLFTANFAKVIGWPLKLISRSTGKLASENAARAPRRTTTTAAALMIGLSLVATVSIAAQSLRVTWSESLNDTVLADWILCSGDCQTNIQASTFGSGLTDELQQLPEVESALIYRSTGEGLAIRETEGLAIRETAEGSDAAGAFGGAAPETEISPATADGDQDETITSYPVFTSDLGSLGRHLDLDIQEGSVEEAGGLNTILHDSIAEDNGLEVGDTVPVVFSSGGETELQIVAIYSENIIAGLSWIVDLSVWDQYFTSTQNRFVSVVTAGGVSQSEASVALEAVVADYPQVELQSKQEFNDSQIGTINQVVTIVNVFLALALVIAFMGIANTLALSVIERTKELGLLRAVGMKRGQTLRMVLGEGVIISVYGGLLGIALGIVFGTVITSLLPEQFISTVAIPSQRLLVYLLIAAAAGLASALLPARRASKLNVLDAIANE